MGSTRRSFTPEYREAAVNFVIDDGRTIVDVAKNIGCSAAVLGRWVQKARNERESSPRPLSEDERKELQELRAENRELKMQLEFAKKVATWFAKDPQ